MTKSNIRVCEPEIHAYLDSLCTEKFYGKLTFFFQDGNIEACRIESTTAKKTIIAQNGIIPPVKKAYQKPCKQVVVPIQKSPYRRFEQEQPQQSAASGTIQQKGSKKHEAVPPTVISLSDISSRTILFLRLICKRKQLLRNGADILPAMNCINANVLRIRRVVEGLNRIVEYEYEKNRI